MSDVTISGDGAEELAWWLRGSVASHGLVVVKEGGLLHVDKKISDPSLRLSSIDVPKSLIFLDDVVDLESRALKMSNTYEGVTTTSIVASAALSEYSGFMGIVEPVGKTEPRERERDDSPDKYYDPDLEIPNCFKFIT